MTEPDRHLTAASRLRRAFHSLGAARALLGLWPPALDDVVNRAAAAAVHAARALADSQWAVDSQPGWDPNWRPGMPRAGDRVGNDRNTFYAELVRRTLERFDKLGAKLALPADFAQYLRTLVEDGLEADIGEAPGYDLDEARTAVQVATRVVATVAGQLGLGADFRAAEERWSPFDDSVTDPELQPVRSSAEATAPVPTTRNP